MLLMYSVLHCLYSVRNETTATTATAAAATTAGRYSWMIKITSYKWSHVETSRLYTTVQYETVILQVWEGGGGHFNKKRPVY